MADLFVCEVDFENKYLILSYLILILLLIDIPSCPPLVFIDDAGPIILTYIHKSGPIIVDEALHCMQHLTIHVINN